MEWNAYLLIKDVVFSSPLCFPRPCISVGLVLYFSSDPVPEPHSLAPNLCSRLGLILCSRRPASDPMAQMSVHTTALPFVTLLRAGRLGKGAHSLYSTHARSFPLMALVTDFNFWQHCNLQLLACCLLLLLKLMSFLMVFPCLYREKVIRVLPVLSFLCLCWSSFC